MPRRQPEPSPDAVYIGDQIRAGLGDLADRIGGGEGMPTGSGGTAVENLAVPLGELAAALERIAESLERRE